MDRRAPNADVLSPYAAEDGHDWRVLSVTEVRQQPGKLVAEIDGDEVPISEGDPDAMGPEGPVALQAWEPDLERAIEADSPVRSNLDLMEELVLLNAAVKAIARSQITGRGVLIIPKGSRFPTKAKTQGDPENDLIEIFMQVAETAIRDPESAPTWPAPPPVTTRTPRTPRPDNGADTTDSRADMTGTGTGTPRPPAGGLGGYHPDTRVDRCVRGARR
ncbi:hypothetical protein [Actinacidiphila rubida]|uniref:Uncharacterized protein n=1 Tax=Actinacidiphila rubida TaxID=310780 RepID=A0A1H8S3V1_9ACTN|nr:hypothetical protein [Actinacidiphila rubida]SEO73272.1 hypothetical protein SAMN05216267_10396 [Actinacidiphila rubida]